MKAIALAAGLLFVQTPMAPRPPADFQGNTAKSISVFYAPPAVVDAVCRRLINEGNPPANRIPDDWTIYACTTTQSRRSILPDPCGAEFATETFASIACHEKGHANGWGWEYG